MKKVYIYLMAAVLLMNAGCEDFIDVNDNPNNPSDVSEALLLAPVEVAINQNIAAGNAATMVNFWLQNSTLNQAAPNSTTYQLNNSDFDGYWVEFYVTNMNNLQILNKKAEANKNLNYAGIAKILTAYSLGNTTDLWGDIPYTTAFQGVGNLTPVYDKQEDIYEAIDDLLDQAIADIEAGTGLTPGGDDYFYEGDMAKWTRLAYSLKARYYMHLTNAPGHTGAAQANLALSALQNGMQSNEDDLKLDYPGGAGNQSPLYQNFSSVTTVILASTFVDSLVSRNDPRLPMLVAPATETGEYKGRGIGERFIGSLESYSRPGSFYGNANSPAFVVNYSESLFLEAEATLRTAGVAAAEPIYQEAIKSHMQKLGLNLNSAPVLAYLQKRGSLTSSNALQRIMEEKSIANYLSVENYVDFRRTGFPFVSRAPNAPASVTEVPTRFLYPLVEITSNPQPQQTAKLTDRIWWDN